MRRLQPLASRRASRRIPGLILAGALLGLASGCAGGAPLLHPAHVLPEGEVSVGGGLSGTLLLTPRAQPSSSSTEPTAATGGQVDLEDLTVASGVAPWVAGRVGIAGDNEAGLTYTGRTLRLDGRHAFNLGAPTLSVGLGASAILARRPGSGADASSVYGGGVDVPILLGFRSSADVYALWLGPRVGFSLLRGSLQRGDAADPNDSPDVAEVSARHLQLGFVLGLRAGFRHLHVAVEVGAAYHRADGELDGTDLSLEQAALAPGGGLILSF
ncbi:hypothetical protein [Chondromyces apiculatus]|uniref:Outer membrane protein beta-barrel domain-containing protein n=1 Tax=Chondromyces apiculatus DSM 436 TaxID=1192034 RepID=A0A017TAI0_9BACT|nr:hypothetical protein [Chondromyces apiculatus]EYF06293.1 Hypothetical protein CAP_2171 [Chondromyces apiculatus DSM 436]